MELVKTFLGLLVTVAVSTCSDELEEYENLVFISCAFNGWTCVNKTDGLSSSISSVTFECPPHDWGRRVEQGYYVTYRTTPDQKYTLSLPEWEKLPLTSITIRNCENIRLQMHTFAPTKIHTLRIEEVQQLKIKNPTNEQKYHPQRVILRNIEYIPTLPKRFISSTDTKYIEIANTTIGLVQQKAINVKKSLENFEWKGVTCIAMSVNAISVSMEDSAVCHIQNSSFPYLLPTSLSLHGGHIVVETSKFPLLQEASIRSSAQSFNFSSNNIGNSKGAIILKTGHVSFHANTYKKYDLSRLIKWTIPDTDKLLESIVLSFTKNVMQDLDDQHLPGMKLIFGESCLSRVVFIKKLSNCSEIHEESGPWINELQENNITMGNLMICENRFPDSVLAVPNNWNFLNFWPHPLCQPSDALSLLDTTAHSELPSLPSLPPPRPNSSELLSDRQEDFQEDLN